MGPNRGKEIDRHQINLPMNFTKENEKKNKKTKKTKNKNKNKAHLMLNSQLTNQRSLYCRRECCKTTN